MALFVVQTNPASGQEEEFNRWYAEDHFRDVLQVPGFVAARRYRKSAAQRVGTPDAAENSWEYLAIYEIEGDPAAAMAELDAALENWMKRSSALGEYRSSIVYDELGDWQLAS